MTDLNRNLSFQLNPQIVDPFLINVSSSYVHSQIHIERQDPLGLYLVL